MTLDTMTRTNIQALYRYMPGQPYNWKRAASVIGRSPRQTTSLNVPERWVAPQLSRLIRPFTAAWQAGAGTSHEMEVIERERFTLVKAEDLRAERFPNTFLCDHCQRFRAVRTNEKPPTCGSEHGPMRQFPWVEVHECGQLAAITPPQCEKGCRAGMHLRNTRSFRISEWYWTCGRCLARSSRTIANWCSTCQKGRVQVERIPRSSLHHPQQITLLNPPTREAFATLAHQDIHRAAVAQCLGALQPGLAGLRVASGGGGAGDTMQKIHDMAAQLGWKLDNPIYKKLLDEAGAKEGKAPAWAEEVDSLGRTPEVVDALGEECLQLALARGATTLTVEKLLKYNDGLPLQPKYAEYRPLFREYRLADITLLRELPIAYLVAGYTRLSQRAKTVTSYREIEPRFRFFDANRDGTFPIYGVRTETEGLLFQLDELEVVRWLVESEVVADPKLSTREEAKHWLFRILQPVTDPFNAPPHPVTAAVLGLVHSMSHRAMKALASRCGLNVDSLAEYLFPVNCAFLIYANTRSEFTLGGIEHVYRYDLADALRDLNAETRCVFDPPCREAFGGACAACLHVSEVACARFNTVLDRNLLFGSLPSSDGAPGAGGEVRWRGYWQR